MRTSEFVYYLPPEAIAQTPVEPRHAARLLDTRDMSDHRFLDLPALLRPGDLVVVNRTRVRHARLRGRKVGTGGDVEALLLRRRGERWEALVRPARRLRAGARIAFGPITATVEEGPTDGVALLRLEAAGDIEEAIAGTGSIPLPPYIHTEPDDPSRYQTIFSDEGAVERASAAAPTAGLHFTADVRVGLAAAGVDLATVELEVGLDTFRPISASEIEDHRIHAERYLLEPATAEAVAATRRRGGRVVAVGTTVTRVLETCAADGGLVRPGSGETRLYLRPGSPFRCVDLLVTNFHVPGSSLVVLVAAFMGEGWREAYATALERGYRFLSFGDAMLCTRRAA
jgi:S-adenosylmethionine:tRNA ribosyltransferase-isomerase